MQIERNLLYKSSPLRAIFGTPRELWVLCDVFSLFSFPGERLIVTAVASQAFKNKTVLSEEGTERDRTWEKLTLQSFLLPNKH